MEKSIIEKLGLNYSQVRSVVENWYLKYTPLIFQSESGLDLEEIVTGNYESDYYEGNAIKDLKLDLLTISQIVSQWYSVNYLQDEQYDGNGSIYNEDNIELDDFCENHIEHIFKSN